MTGAREERRRWPRFELSCPIVIRDGRGKELLRTRTANISDGGALLLVTASEEIGLGEGLRLDLQIPRQTPNTYMLEPAAARATALRRHDQGDGKAAVAVMFIEPLRLELEV